MKILRHFYIIMIFIFLLFLPVVVKAHSPNEQLSYKNKSLFNVLVDIPEFKLYLINKATNAIVKTYPIAGGKLSTPSPYGTWTIVSKSSDWGAGFGSRWMELNVPWGTYGIHGTNKPLSISHPNSLGCIRMFNKDVAELYKFVDCGTTVVIYGGPYGLAWNHFRNLKPGDKGADVLDIQKRLKDRGYYFGKLDGIYGDVMKKAIIKYRKDNNLELTHNLNKEFYDSIGINSFE